MASPAGFAMQATKDGRVRISHHGRVVTTLTGADAARLLSRARSAGDEALQQLLARATGHYAHGNKARGRG